MSLQRNTEILKKIITFYVIAENCIVNNGFSGYLFLSSIFSPYEHSIHNHEDGISVSVWTRRFISNPLVPNEGFNLKNLLCYT